MYRQYRDTLFDYKGGYGGAKKKDIYDFTDNIQAPWEFIPTDPQHVKQQSDGATFWLTNSGLASRYKRDFAYDKANPREELPISAVDLKQINVISNLSEVMPDLSTPYDYAAHDQVRLYQDSIVNYTGQRDFFTDPKQFDEMEKFEGKTQKYNTEAVGQATRGHSQQSLYAMDGSAAGKETNYIIDKSGPKRNSAEWIYAF